MLKGEKQIGLVAGRGYLPFDALQEMRNQGIEPVVIGLAGEVDPGLKNQVKIYKELAPGQMGAIIAELKSYSVTELVFEGKIGKEALFKGGFDQTVQRLLSTLPQKNDDAVLLAIVNEIENNGIKVLKQTEFLRKHLPAAGPITGELTLAELADVQFGFKMAKASGGLDFGQSVVVKQGMVLAVEAIEGTDQAILRGGTLGGPGTVVVKVSKPNQDERFDVPTVGRRTIESMIGAKAAVLAIEAGKTLITEQTEFNRLALENGIKVIAVEG
ncbi:MAG TPA: UDP-2,3-diacylglucosamine diphosphatase LpxI [Bacillota bacterium]|nr:UDP-2,3-diacylglucosamine diphosphatase LpxI [Bacillota bacterium]